MRFWRENGFPNVKSNKYLDLIKKKKKKRKEINVLIMKTIMERPNSDLILAIAHPTIVDEIQVSDGEATQAVDEAFGSIESASVADLVVNSASDAELLVNSDADAEEKEADMQELDRCLTGIEDFCGKIQEKAAAAKERKSIQLRLNESVKSRRNSSKDKKDLKRRSQILTKKMLLPSHDEFVNNFKLYKIAFNILAKYGNRIQQPSGPELIHILFNPLHYTVDASRGVTKDGDSVAAKVDEPLLTEDAKAMLQKTLTPLEKRIWSSMGQNWSFTQEEREKALNPKPSAITPLLEEPEQEYVVAESKRSANTETVAAVTVAAADADADADADATEEVEIIPPDEISVASANYVNGVTAYVNSVTADVDDVTADVNGLTADANDVTIDVNNNSETNESDYARINKIYSENIDGQPLSVSVDAPVENGDARPDSVQANQVIYLEKEADDVDAELASKTFYEIRTSKKLLKTFGSRMKTFEQDLISKGITRVETTFDRNAKYIQELTVRKSEVLEVVDDSKNWWFVRNWRGEDGYIPKTIVKVLS